MASSSVSLKNMTLKEFICCFSLDLEEYYGEDFGYNDTSSSGEDGGSEGDTLIMCLVDTGPGRNTSKRTSQSLRKAGLKRRQKIKHRYSYDNPMNRIHGFLIGEKVTNSLIPSHNKIISLSLICSSVFSDKKGIGSDLMNRFLEQSKAKGYTDVILEVANEWSGVDVESEEEDETEEEEDEEEEESDVDAWEPSEEVIDIISHEFWRKTMRKPTTNQPYYNVAEDYIRSLVSDYMYDLEDDICHTGTEPLSISDEDDPKDNEYGGFW